MPPENFVQNTANEDATVDAVSADAVQSVFDLIGKSKPLSVSFGSPWQSLVLLSERHQLALWAIFVFDAHFPLNRTFLGWDP